jgi:hypothetical protein
MRVRGVTGYMRCIYERVIFSSFSSILLVSSNTVRNIKWNETKLAYISPNHYFEYVKRAKMTVKGGTTHAFGGIVGMRMCVCAIEGRLSGTRRGQQSRTTRHLNLLT